MKKAVLFDLDGTLLNTNKLIIESFKHTYKTHLDFEVSESEIISSFGEPLSTTLSRYAKNGLQEMIETFRVFNYENHDNMTEIINGVEDTLEELATKGHKLGVVTSKRELMVKKGLKLFNIEKYFDIVITPEMTNLHKPNPEPIYKACEYLEISSKETIMIGDSIFDILCGKNAGSETCLVNYTLLNKNEINKHSPDYNIDNIKDILTII